MKSNDEKRRTQQIVDEKLGNCNAIAAKFTSGHELTSR